MSSLDKNITTNLIETLEDGRKGFAEAANMLSNAGHPELSTRFSAFSTQREAFSTELENLAATYGDNIDESGSVLATVHRGWMTIKDFAAGSSPSGVIEAAVQGENYALKQYSEALQQDMSPGLREVVTRQFTEIQKVERELSSMLVAA